MGKIIPLLFLTALLLCVSCTGKQPAGNGEDYFSGFDVVDFLQYNNIAPADIVLLAQDSQQLIFALDTLKVTENRDSYHLIQNYIDELSASGYQLTTLDGTVISTFMLENGQYTVCLYLLSLPDAEAKANFFADFGASIPNLDLIEGEDFIFSLLKQQP